MFKNLLKSDLNEILYVLALLFILLLPSCGVGGGNSGSSNNVTTKAKWTFAVYMDGDNNLNSATSTNLDWLKEVGSNKNVNVVVELDTSDDATKRLAVFNNKIVTVSDLGELNMSDNATLIDFIKWIKQSYPAKHYFIVLWDHGLGFENSNPNASRDILWDNHYDNVTIYNDSNSMSIPSLGFALKQATEILGKKIDILGMDACLMNMVEVGYQIENYADYLVASENTEPFDGWPYNNILSFLENNPNASSDEIAKYTAETYVDFYGSSYLPTMSVVELYKLDNVTSSLNLLAKDLINSIDNATSTITTELNTIQEKVQRFDENGDDKIDNNDSYADLYNFAQLIYKDDNLTSNLRNDANNFINSINNCVIANYHAGSDVSNAYGLSIWLPTETNYNLYKNYYSKLKFAQDTDWEKFLGKLMP